MNRAEFAMPANGARLARVVRWRGGVRSEVEDWISEEVPVALEFNGISHAVMLATPADLEDFALGFGLAEGIFTSASELYGCEIEVDAGGITLRLEVSARCFAGLKERRRTLAGRTGCGLCGTESLDQVLRPLPRIAAEGAPLSARAIATAMREMRERQRLCEATGAVHAAAWCDREGHVQWLREDVGRHNALDKLIGALARAQHAARDGFIAVTSRASVEMVQKAAMAGAPLLAAVSAPTLLAIETARAAGMGLVGLARQDDLVVYAHAERVALAAAAKEI
ncbi:MAG TPA: formate dehydrogenase accessory sulfurtransferase FdhD [Burkholderiaceae bacterium]|nr:formate dehydrogenase accessory sulfurtransferase FdhD [Burkholderiaceae bacterium]